MQALPAPDSARAQYARCRSLLERGGFAPERYVALAAGPRGRGYRELSPALFAAEAAAGTRRALLNRCLLADALGAFDPQASRVRLPPSVLALYPAELSRIGAQLTRFDDDYFSLDNDLFLKDLAVLQHRLIPLGAEYAQPGDGVPRSVLFKGGVPQLVGGLRFMLNAGGFQPYFSLHTHLLVLDEFHAEGCLRMYHRLAELLQLNADVKGWISASWFLDPELEQISPHLTHLRALPARHGAAIFFVRREGADSGALVKSATRRRLFAEGCYVPKTYMRVWPRRAVLDWQRRSAGSA